MPDPIFHFLFLSNPRKECITFCYYYRSCFKAVVVYNASYLWYQIYHTGLLSIKYLKYSELPFLELRLLLLVTNSWARQWRHLCVKVSVLIISSARTLFFLNKKPEKMGSGISEISNQQRLYSYMHLPARYPIMSHQIGRFSMFSYLRAFQQHMQEILPKNNHICVKIFFVLSFKCGGLMTTFIGIHYYM